MAINRDINAEQTDTVGKGTSDETGASRSRILRERFEGRAPPASDHRGGASGKRFTTCLRLSDFETPKFTNMRKNRTMPSTTENAIRHLHSLALVFRFLAVCWSAFTVLSFGFLAVWPQPEFQEACPFLIGGTVLSILYTAALIWPVKPDVRHRLPRIEMVLRWQVATGITIAFALGFAVRAELQMSFWLYGTYLVLSAISLLSISLVSKGLQKRYAESDDKARKAELDYLVARIATNTARQLSTAMPELLSLANSADKTAPERRSLFAPGRWVSRVLGKL